MKPYVVGDTPLLRGTCVDEDTSSAVNLTGCTVTLRWSINGGTAQEGAMVVEDAAAGIAKRQWTAGNLNEEGRLVFDVLVVVTASGFRYTSQEFRRDIRRAVKS